MSRRDHNQQIHQRVVHHQVVTSLSPEILQIGEYLPTYTTQIVHQPVQYSARHYYQDHSHQSRSPVIRVAQETNPIYVQQVHQVHTPVGQKQDIRSDLEKTQNLRRVAKPVQEEPKLQESFRQSQNKKADEIIKRYSSGENTNGLDILSHSANQKHSIDTIDVLNKKYGLGLEEMQNPLTAAKKKHQPYGFDSQMTVPNGFMQSQEQADTNRAQRQQKQDNNMDQFDGDSNDIESVNLDIHHTAHKPTYEKENKIIQRRETVDPPVSNKIESGKNPGMVQSNSDKLFESLNNKDANVTLKNNPSKLNQDTNKSSSRQRNEDSARKESKDKYPLSVISSAKSRHNQDHKNSLSPSGPSAKFKGKDGEHDEDITVASARELDYYFQKYDSIPINDFLRYIGPIKNGKFHGLGRILTNKGEIVYEGEFYQGKYDGKGKLWNFLKKSKPKQIPIPAEIVANYMTLATANYLKDLSGGKGILNVNFTEDNWEFYRGYFKDGKKHGCGKLKLSDGRVYEGEFVHGLANGYGMLHYFEKSLAGRWEDNMLVQFL